MDGSEGSPGLTYAFALFNLGNAFRLAGRPEEAIPVLERRLEIPNQRSTVERERALARQQVNDWIQTFRARVLSPQSARPSLPDFVPFRLRRHPRTERAQVPFLPWQR